MRLNKKPKTEIEYNGKKYHLVPWFDQVLDFLDVTEDCTDGEKGVLALDFFVYERVPYDAGLLYVVMREVFGEAKNGGENSVDFKQDAERIYAGFLQAYGIDLYEQHGKMHWQTFIALLGNLPSDTAFSEVVNIRTRKVPKPTKYNQEEVRELLRLKAKYRIEESEQEKQRRLGQQWAGVWNALIKGSE